MGHAEPVLENISDDAVLAGIDLNWRASVRAFGLAPSTTIRDDGELFWYVTGLPSGAFNTIMFANLAPDRIDAAVAELHGLRARYGVPVGWLIGPASRPLDLGGQLAARGLTHRRDLTAMTLALASLPVLPEPVPGLGIERVADAAAYDAWIRAEQRGFADHDGEESGLAELRRAMGIGHTLPLYHFLGRLHGAPVATATLMLAGGIAGVYDVSTVPEARRQGIGTAMTMAALQMARARGYEIAFLQPSEMGKSLYERIGFRERCACPVYA